MQNQPSISPDALDTALIDLSRQGWRLQHRTPTTMQLVKPKTFKATEGVLLAIVCGALVLLAGVMGILIALLLALGDFIWYSARRDETTLVAVDASGRVTRISGSNDEPTTEGPAVAHYRRIGACVHCGALIDGMQDGMIDGRRVKCPRCKQLAA